VSITEQIFQSKVEILIDMRAGKRLHSPARGVHAQHLARLRQPKYRFVVFEL